MAFEKVKPGQPWNPSAAEHNAMIDAALAYRGNRHPQKPVFGMPLDHNVVLIRNMSGADRDAFHVLAMDDAAVVPSLGDHPNMTVIDGKQPDPENKPHHRHRVAILTEKIKSTEVGRALIGGQYTMPIDVVNVLHTRARVLDSGKFQSGFFGPVRILSAAAAGLAKPCRVLIDGYDGGHCLATGVVADGDWATPSDNDCDLAWIDPATGAASAINSPFENAIKVYHYGQAIEDVDYFQCRVICGRIVPDVAYCP